MRRGDTIFTLSSRCDIFRHTPIVSVVHLSHPSSIYISYSLPFLILSLSYTKHASFHDRTGSRDLFMGGEEAFRTSAMAQSTNDEQPKVFNFPLVAHFLSFVSSSNPIRTRRSTPATNMCDERDRGLY